MRTQLFLLSVIATICFIPGEPPAADEPTPASTIPVTVNVEPDEPSAVEDGEAAVLDEDPYGWGADLNQLDYGAPYIDIQQVLDAPSVAIRFGGWGVINHGSRAGTGEWQELDSFAPFYDVDFIRSNGFQTLDAFVTGSENEATAADAYFYGGPGLTIDVDYDRFLHRTGHDRIIQPFGGFYNPQLPAATPGSPMFAEDFNESFDNALRVQKLDAVFKGRISDNVRWRLNVWGMKKEGFRQANSTQHCYSVIQPGSGGTRTCHVVSQSQRIDWLTMEIEPVIEARFDWLTAEYSRTMRSFQQDDQMVMNNFQSLNGNYGLQSVGAYGYVPENFTAIDRLKLHGQIDPFNEVYVVGHVGNTHNKFRESDRKFYGVDARLTNTSVDGLSVTAYGKTFTQNSSPDTLSLNDRYPSQAGLWLEQDGGGMAVTPQAFYPTRDPGLDHNPYISMIDRRQYSLGVKARWRPFQYDVGLINTMAITAGYDYSQLNRTNVDYFVRATDPVRFTQPDTAKNTFTVGIQQDIAYSLNAYVRYKMVDTNYPLVGITPRQTLSLDAAVNSNLPEHEDRIEIGGNWNPADNFLMSASFWIQNTYNHSDLVNFDEDNYPVTVTGWYALDDQWSFSAGWATFSNWIEQDITLGREDGIGAGELPAWTSEWSYTGRSNVFNIGTAYVYSQNVTLTGGFEYIRSWNYFDAPPAPATAVTDYSDIATFSQVRVNQYRMQAGVDVWLTNNVNTFFRYNYINYDDQVTTYKAGESHMFLGGVSGVY